MKENKETVLLALGSNLGDRRAALSGARGALERNGEILVRAWSRIFETAPQGGAPDQPRYFNAVLAVATPLSPEQLLARCQAVEREFGRERRERWGPRTLDIDILAFGDRISETPALILPHPRLHLRSFVLLPLLEVTPEWRHPRLGKTVRRMVAELPETALDHPLAGTW
ncbi:MAG: 2-amino-4-hydroxy-6-hydroxymethyldihydropteridine diphosphokinase [Deltaproteobacteria bacterium]|nr:2-amino-4-hydroxy-6-hydroxymethyldihydropteridine diphosphokinase [Deltaproteobacteria bacterium]